jgi:hypothetical protein
MDSFRKIVLTNRILAACLLGTLLWNWVLVGMLFRTEPWGVLGIVLLVLFGLMVGSAVGLLRLTSWGYYLTYTLVPFATIFHGIALVPGAVSLVPGAQAKTVAVFVLNLSFLFAAIRSHRSLRAIGFLGEGGSRRVAAG